MRLPGLRVLVVEDEPFLQLELIDMLEECGCKIAGAAARVAPALQLADEAAFDIALLDVNLGGETVNPVVEALEERGTPYLFLTGYGTAALEGRPGAVAVEKPYDRHQLMGAMAQVLKEHQ